MKVSMPRAIAWQNRQMILTYLSVFRLFVLEDSVIIQNIHLCWTNAENLFTEGFSLSVFLSWSIRAKKTGQFYRGQETYPGNLPSWHVTPQRQDTVLCCSWQSMKERSQMRSLQYLKLLLNLKNMVPNRGSKEPFSFFWFHALKNKDSKSGFLQWCHSRTILQFYELFFK